MIGLE